jgi:hypothetical protein
LWQWANEIHREFLEWVAGNGGLQCVKLADWLGFDEAVFASNESFDRSGEHAGEPEGAAKAIGSCRGTFVGHNCEGLHDDARRLGFGDDKAATFGRVVGVRVDQEALVDFEVEEFVGDDAPTLSAGFEEVLGGWVIGLDERHDLTNGGVVHLVPEDLGSTRGATHEAGDTGVNGLLGVAVEGANVWGGTWFVGQGVEEVHHGLVFEEKG